MALLKGYRELSKEEIDMVNFVKTVANDLGKLCGEVGDIPGVDQRWLSIGKTHLQQGFMAMVRSITKPEGF